MPRARFRSWTHACLAAFSIDDHGAFVGPWMPWRHGMIGRSDANARYSTDEAIQAVRDCAWAIGRIPRVQHYQAWGSARAERLRAIGITPRIPTIGVIYRLLASERSDRSRWTTVLERAFPDAVLA